MYVETDLQKEMMDIETFLETYSLSRSKFYSESKKFPWLVSKLGNRTYIKRSNAEKWMGMIGADSVQS